MSGVGVDPTGRRVAHLPAAVLGNGSLLATLSARGELERVFWPRVDWAQQLGELRLGIMSEGRTRWLDEEPFTHEQSYFQDATVLRTLVRDGDLELELVDHVVAGAPVLARRLRTDERGLRLVVYCRPELAESRRYGGVWAHPESGCVVFYRRDMALAVGVIPTGKVSCGADKGEIPSVVDEAAPGKIGAASSAHGPADAVLIADLNGEAVLLCAFGASPDAALAELARHAGVQHDELLDARVRHDADRLVSAPPEMSGVEGLGPLYRRSLLVFDLVASRDTGGVIAAPELDPEFVESGGYGFVWPRDLAFTALAFLASGREDLLRRALAWSLRTQSAEGVWLQRHWTDGFLAPSWTQLQLDETGAMLLAYEAAFRELRDDSLDRELWLAARRAANFLVEFREPGTGLPQPSFDLWEEDEGRHAYTAASVIGGLRAAACMAGRHERRLAEGYSRAADEVRDALETELWSEEQGHYVRSTDDSRLDSSLLGLAWPFGAVDARSPRMRSTVKAIERALAAGAGGLRRYEGDTYAGGNAWVLAALWLGLVHRQAGHGAGHLRSLAYATDVQTVLGLLPEQVTDDGRPAWVVPLTWSHAMLVLAARPELSLVDELASQAGQRRTAARLG